MRVLERARAAGVAPEYVVSVSGRQDWGQARNVKVSDAVMARLSAVIFPAKIPETNSSEVGCIFFRSLMCATELELIISGVLILKLLRASRYPPPGVLPFVSPNILPFHLETIRRPLAQTASDGVKIHKIMNQYKIYFRELASSNSNSIAFY